MFFSKSKESSQHDLQIAKLKDYYEDKLRDYRIENEMLKMANYQILQDSSDIEKEAAYYKERYEQAVERSNKYLMQLNYIRKNNDNIDTLKNFAIRNQTSLKTILDLLLHLENYNLEDPKIKNLWNRATDVTTYFDEDDYI